MTRRNRPRVAFVQWNDLIGGAEVFTEALVPELRKIEIDASIIVVGRAGDNIRSLGDHGVPIAALGHGRGRAVVRDFRPFLRAVGSLGSDAVVLPNVGFLAPILRLGGYAGTIVAVEHGSVLQIRRLSAARRLLHRLERRISYGSVDIQVAVSDFIAHTIANGSGSDEQVRIHNGIRLGAAAEPLSLPSTGIIRCGILGRLVEGKGFEVAIRTIAELGDLPQVRLAVFGDGPIAHQLEALAARHGVSDRVEFRGWTSPEVAWKECSICLAIPDLIVEGFGLSALEAQASGIPVIATASGGLTEVVMRDVSGVFVEPGEPGDTAAAIRHYVSNPTLYHHHSEGAITSSKRFDIRRVADQYSALLRKAGQAPR